MRRTAYFDAKRSSTSGRGPMNVRSCALQASANVASSLRNPTDADRLVGEPHRQGVAVRFAVGDHGGQAEVPAGAQDANGDLAPVGDENLADHDA
jgi:hypothetical protein